MARAKLFEFPAALFAIAIVGASLLLGVVGAPSAQAYPYPVPPITVTSGEVIAGQAVTFKISGFKAGSLIDLYFTIKPASNGSPAPTPTNTPAPTHTPKPKKSPKGSHPAVISSALVENIPGLPSDAKFLKSVRADSTGAALVQAAFDAPGNYTLFAVGIDPSGHRRIVELAFTVHPAAITTRAKTNADLTPWFVGLGVLLLLAAAALAYLRNRPEGEDALVDGGVIDLTDHDGRYIDLTDQPTSVIDLTKRDSVHAGPSDEAR